MNTDKLFETMRQSPVDIPIGKVEQFVIASAAAGTFATLKTGLLKKLAIKFHLNSISAMITIPAAATATIATVLAVSLSNGSSKTADTNNHSKQEKTILAPEVISQPENNTLEIFALDSPGVSTAKTPANTKSTIVIYTSGDSVTTKTVAAGTGNTVTISSNAPDLKVVYASAPEENDSNSNYAYAFSYGNANRAYPQLNCALYGLNHLNTDLEDLEDNEAKLAEAEAMLAYRYAELSRLAALRCEKDSFRQALEDQLLKDGLIKDKEEYSFQFDGKSMKVNGVKQSAETWEKYKTFIENNSDFKINKKFEYGIWVNRDGTSINIDDGK